MLLWKLKWHRQIPLIVISCYCFQYEAESFLGNGVDKVICKPFDILKLGAWLFDFLANPQNVHPAQLKMDSSGGDLKAV
jgi:CheY-like chemotaxis protein